MSADDSMAICLLLCTTGFTSSVPAVRPAIEWRATPLVADLVPASAVAEFVEAAAVRAASAVESSPLILPKEISTGSVPATFVRTECSPSELAPILLLHSFDSSCLEMRRVMPLLEARGLEAYSVDILGWGFIDTANATNVGVEAKREHLRAIIEQLLDGRPALLVGSSLGAATIIDFASAHRDLIAGAVLLDPQGFIDGAPPVPAFAARAGLKLLRSWPLRSFGQYVAYEDIPTLATDDAVRIGRVHCARPAWEDDGVEWLLGGGYSVSSLVPDLDAVPTLILWGRQDRVLPPAEYVPKFVRALPRAQFRWVEECGHVPHLEQPEVTADAIARFARGETLEGDSDVSSLLQN